MQTYRLKADPWDFCSWLAILIFAFLQILRWPVLPQFMDIYYHLLTAWGFIQSGGVAAWDFWQYAPIGRPHLYPPLFHILLVPLIKAGISTVFLAKFLEAFIPVLFLMVLWFFLRRNFGKEAAFFSLLASSSSFSFTLSLINHLPATLALILGMLSYHYLLKKGFIRPALLLALSFYTHIGVSWFLFLGLIFYALLAKQARDQCLRVITFSLILVLPILWQLAYGAKFIAHLGLSMQEKYICQIKFVDYFIAIFGLILSFKLGGPYYLFCSLFFASFIFIVYPFRFFSGEGYLAVALLSSVFLTRLLIMARAKRHLRPLLILIIIFILFLSPTLSLNKPPEVKRVSCKINLFDSSFMGTLLARGGTIWFPREYLPVASLIRSHSDTNEIIYSTLNLGGVILGGVSGRATANALLPEIGVAKLFDPFKEARIIIFTLSDKAARVNRIVKQYNLVKIGQSKIFFVYKNLYCNYKLKAEKALLPFWVISILVLVFLLIFWQAERLEANLKKYLT